MYLYKYFLIFSYYFLAYINVVQSKYEINDGIQYTAEDSENRGWNNEQLALLRARLDYQDILPKTTLIDLKDDEFLKELINYFHLAIDKVKRFTDGETQRIHLKAMSDVLGGYFRRNLIPLTKRAFYAGTINYGITQQVVKFYDDIKAFLHTDGRNWAPPSDFITKRFMWDAAPHLRDFNRNTRKSNGKSCDKITYTNEDGFIYIPTPFFDSKKHPTSIAMAFKENPLRNLDHENAIDCLWDFYTTAKQCLLEKKASVDNIHEFNTEFETFLDNNVYPHLMEEKIYPAFGGIFQVKNEMNKRSISIVKRDVVQKPIVHEQPHLPQIRAAILDNDDMVPFIVLVFICCVAALWLGLAIYFRFKKEKPVVCEPPKPEKCKCCRQTYGGTAQSAPNVTAGKPTLAAKKGPAAAPAPDDKTKWSLNPFRKDRVSVTPSKSKPVVKSGSTSPSKGTPRKCDCDPNAKKKTKCFICMGNTTQYGYQMSRNKPCPKCKRKHCRCVDNIWSSLSNCTITYPRIFSQKNTLLQKHVEIKTTNHNAVTICPLCKTPACKHAIQYSENVDYAQRPAHFTVEMTELLPKGPARNIQSAPVTNGNARKADTQDQVFVFGYDFETSCDDSSSTDDTSGM